MTLDFVGFGFQTGCSFQTQYNDDTWSLVTVAIVFRLIYR